MQVSQPLPKRQRCPVCRADINSNSTFCANCGSPLEETPAETLRALNYLLSELDQWEKTGLITGEQATTLRQNYERQREILLAQVVPHEAKERPPEPAEKTIPSTEVRKAEPAQAVAAKEPSRTVGPSTVQGPAPQRTSRPIIETLTDPHNLRLLLYTGAAMIVVSVILWLRDVLYLKLQEPVVQAGLLATVTLGFTVSGWFVTLRTRQRFTGRALTLIGSLLVPVNYWFLVRSNLIAARGRAWMVCAFCALLYACTAALLSEKLLAYASAVFASAAFLTALRTTSLPDETIFALCALWPLILYAGAWLAQRAKRLPQLAGPFTQIADAEFLLLIFWSSAVAFFLHLSLKESVSWRAPMFFVLSGGALYGLWRVRAGRSNFGAVLASVATLVLSAASVDALKQSGWLPGTWPVAVFVIGMAFLIRKTGALWLPSQDEGAGLGQQRPPEFFVRQVADMAAVICALLWLVHAFYYMREGGFGSSLVLLLALLYWLERAVGQHLSWAAHFTFAHAGAFLLALLIGLHVDEQWFTLILALILPALIFSVGQQARGIDWLAAPAKKAAPVAAILIFTASLLQAVPHLRTGDALLLPSCLAVSVVALFSLAASLFSVGPARTLYFRAFLLSGVMAFALGCLRAGYDPLSEVEVYTSPVAVVLLLIAYLSARGEWAEYERDASALLWMGSALLCGPLLLHALEYRLLFDLPAPMRDLAVLLASLLLTLFGVMGRLRALVLTGMSTLITELAALALSSVHWTQVPLKVYLITVGSLLALAGWLFEYRREQLINLRDRFKARRRMARERLGQWR